MQRIREKKKKEKKTDIILQSPARTGIALSYSTLKTSQMSQKPDMLEVARRTETVHPVSRGVALAWTFRALSPPDCLAKVLVLRR